MQQQEIEFMKETASMLLGIGILIGIGIVSMLFMMQREMRELHLSLNSRMDKLLDTTRLLARAEGFKAGQEDRLAEIRDFKDGEQAGG